MVAKEFTIPGPAPPYFRANLRAARSCFIKHEPFRKLQRYHFWNRRDTFPRVIVTEPIAYLNGDVVPISAARLSIFDMGLVGGVSVTEMIRTFRHEPFRLEDHLDRLVQSLRYVGLAPSETPQDLERIARDVIERNGRLIANEHDLGLVVFVTAGPNPTYTGTRGGVRVPSVGVHTFPLPFEFWVDKIDAGQHLITPSIQAIPPNCVDPRVKSRSRMHWHLADRQARGVDPHAAALVVDGNGHITETSTGNFFVVEGRSLRTPPAEKSLAGISRRVVCELAEQCGLQWEFADLTVYDVSRADEAFTTSTPYCMLPVARLNGQPIGSHCPGPVFRQLSTAWSELVGLDIIGQIRVAGRQPRQQEATS